jgi:hypothetical protein
MNNPLFVSMQLIEFSFLISAPVSTPLALRFLVLKLCVHSMCCTYDLFIRADVITQSHMNVCMSTLSGRKRRSLSINVLGLNNLV